MYRVALWYPELVSQLFVVCTPYRPPSKKPIDLEAIVKTKLPNFAYQIQLASGEVEMHIQTKEQIKQFLCALFGGRTPEGKLGFDVRKGILFENLHGLSSAPLLNGAMLDYYAEQCARNGIHSTRECLWRGERSTNTVCRLTPIESQLVPDPRCQFRR